MSGRLRFVVPVVMAVVVALVSGGCAGKKSSVESELAAFAEDKDARIGVAVITDGGEIFGVNADEQFPLLSVVKFPLALAVADFISERGGSFDDPVAVTAADLHRDTWSPMLEKYGWLHGDSCRRDTGRSGACLTDTASVSVGELMYYSMSLSDNNACDILMELVGGAEAVGRYLSESGHDGFAVRWDENEMNIEPSRYRENTSTPMAMAKLLRKFDMEADDVDSKAIKRIMESCETGRDRLVKPFEGSGAVVGHKTGTGPVDKSTGRIVAVNDAGYVHLADGGGYVIVVFVCDSAYTLDETAAIIAEISGIVALRVGRL